MFAVEWIAAAISHLGAGRRDGLPARRPWALSPWRILLFLFFVPVVPAWPSPALAAGLSGGPAAAEAGYLEPPEGVVITVEFSKKLRHRIGAIDRVEQTMEERWRRHRITTAGVLASDADRRGYSERRASTYAGERLIPALGAYTAANIVKSATAYNLKRALPAFRGRIDYEIRKLKVTGHPIAFLNGSHSYVLGRVKVTAADGRVIFAKKVSVQLVGDQSPAFRYDGPRLAFIPSDADRRVAPVLTAFVEKALKAAFPEQADEIVGPVFAPATAPEADSIAP